MVKGPAAVEVQGRCSAVGCDVSGRTVLVRAGKVLPFEPDKSCRLRVKLGRGGRSWSADSLSAGMSMWQRHSRILLSMLSKRDRVLVVLVVGSTDAGKSTLCAYLANVAIRSGYLPNVIDGDMGQGDLAPPSAIGSVMLTKQITDLRDTTASVYEFIGRISPVGVERLVSDSLVSIQNKSSRSAHVCIINTDGYVSDGGIWYKKMIANQLKPDIIVCLGRNKELVDALAGGPWEIKRARSSSQAYKSRLERTLRRQDQFLRFVGDGFVIVDRSRISFVYMGKTYSSVVMQDPAISDTVSSENLTMMFVGLGSDNEVAGFGMIVDVKQSLIQIRTDVAGFSQVYLSDVRIENNGATRITPA